MLKRKKKRCIQVESDSDKPLKKCKKIIDKQNFSSEIIAVNKLKKPEEDKRASSTVSSHDIITKKPTDHSRETPFSRDLSNSTVQLGSETIKSLSVSQLLDLGESKICEEPANKPENTSGLSEDSEEEDWEEVKVAERNELEKSTLPEKGIDITLELPKSMGFNKRKKKTFDLEAHIKRQMNHVKRELQLLSHKVHVLCWIAHLFFVNKILNSESLMAQALSLVSSKNVYPPKHADLNYLKRFVTWFHTTISLKDNTKDSKCCGGLLKELCYQFQNKSAFSKKDFILMMIIFLRVVGLKTRLVMSFQVIPIRPKNVELIGNNKSNQKILVKEKKCILKKSHILIKRERDKTGKTESSSKRSNEKNYFFNEENVGIKIMEKNASQSDIKEQIDQNVEFQKLQKRSKRKYKGKDVKIKESEISISTDNCKSIGKENSEDLCENTLVEDSSSDESFGYFKKVPQQRRKKISSNKHKEKNKFVNAAHVDVGSKTVNVTCKASNNKDVSLNKNSRGKGKLLPNSKKYFNGEVNLKQKTSSKDELAKFKFKNDVFPCAVEKNMIEQGSSSDTDSHFVPQSLMKRRSNEIDRRVLSSDEETEAQKGKGIDLWAEVFLEFEGKWITVDVLRQKIHCVNEIYSRATHPVSYIIACNNDSTLKDVTKRYVPNWHSDTRKRRVDEDWWQETLWPYIGPNTLWDRDEDEDIDRQLLDKPLPSSITEYKDHPLYALRRHLLKFEEIYPPDAPTLGFVKGEAVYARECVVTLRSREVWYKEARVVRLQEQPYKIVKARPKFDKMTGEIKKDLPLELFGIWQTEEYLPPIATNGKVPRNEYGNVDLFKPSMLPKGTVHLQIPGLNKLAKKLGIDCASAVVGFDFHSGASHPVLDGFVVCEEFKDVLLDAWNKEIDEVNKKNEEKRMKKIYGNWKCLIRGLLIREKLKIKYAFGGDDNHEKELTSKSKIGKRS